uniref:Pichia acaciae NRRL Y-18665 plasmid pPac1-2 killer toxin protein n=1 Tax=Millerozyma acaciae TaxID=28986 RepID=Q01498_9ASCO|nr:similar to Kluyveromyces lactis killer toxin, Swiss-Prot accession number P09805 [Millerozyma acaciae]CAE84961.1 hypothetical protein [Millerozyma acaciae]
MLIIVLLFLATLANSLDCSGDVFFGYTRGDKTDVHKSQALTAVKNIKRWLGSFETRQSFKVIEGDIAGFAWVGSYIKNSDFVDNVIEIMYNEVNKNGIPVELYIENIVDNEPGKSFGFILNSHKNLENAQKAVKNWSTGVKYNVYEGNKIYKDHSVCYLDESKKKPEANDKEAGECYYTRLGDNSNPYTQVKTPKPYLDVFNSNNLTKIVSGEAFCYSEGSLPDVGICVPIKSNMDFKYYNKSPKQDLDKQKVINALNTLSKNFTESENRQSFIYQKDNIVGYMWLGQRINNTENLFNSLTNEVTKNGVPDHFYYEYAKNDPMIQIGIFINKQGNVDLAKQVGKVWSTGKQFNNITGKKSISTSFCILDNKEKRGFTNDYSVGQCLNFTYEENVNVGLTDEILVEYNPGFYSANYGDTLCKSIGYPPSNKPIKDYCKFYIVQEDDTCVSIASKYPGLTEQDIIDYNSKNGDFYGCFNLWEGDKICISKPYM